MRGKRLAPEEVGGIGFATADLRWDKFVSGLATDKALKDPIALSLLQADFIKLKELLKNK